MARMVNPTIVDIKTFEKKLNHLRGIWSIDTVLPSEIRATPEIGQKTTLVRKWATYPTDRSVGSSAYAIVFG